MKIKYFISLAMAVTLMTACSNEEDLGTHITNGMLQATVEGNAPSARAGFNRDGAFYWSAGDRIGVTTSTSTTSFSALALSDGAGQASGSFNGEVTGSIEGYAVYPYSDKHAMKGSTLTYEFPASYTYTTVDTDYFSPAQGQGNSFNPAMWGKITNGSVGLKHLGGVFCIKMEKLPVGTDLKLTLTTDQKMNGTYTVDLSTDSPKLEAQSAGNEEEKTVTITFSNNTDNTSGVFYIPVPTGTYNNVRLKILEGTTEKANVACGNYTIGRRDLKRLIISNGTITGGEEKTVNNVSDVANALGTSNAVSVANQVTGTENTISLPAQTAVAPVSVAFQNIASDAKISFTDGASVGATSIENLTISIPAGVEPSIDCTLEKSTVTLSSNAGIATYNEVTAATAENTLIIDKGVTVKTLKVKKGNVKVRKGSKITAIERTSENQSVVKIYKEEGAEIPQSLDGNTFTVLSAEIADMEAVAKNGGTYTLTSDMILSSPLVVEKTMTLYLNGHSIKPKAEGLDKVLNTQDALILVRRGADLTINDNGNGSIDCNGVTKAAVKLTDSNDTGSEIAKLTVNGGLLSGSDYGICGNGLRHGTEIIINGGIITAATVSGDVAGIYHPQDGTLTINGGEISGATGIEIRSGVLTVNEGKIKSTATQFTETPNGNGTTITGAAVAVSQHVTQKALSATVAGGTLEGPYALYEKDFHEEPVDNISLSVTAGTFAGGVFSDNCSAFVTGGTFSDLSAMAYLAEKADVNVALSKDCTMEAFNLTGNGQTIAVDLNKHTLTLSGDCDSKISATASFKNGSIVMSHVNHKIYGVGGKLIFDKVHISGSNYALWVQGPDATLDVINGSKIEANYFPVSTNAGLKDNELVYGANAIITLKNSEFIGTETGFMNNVPAVVTIDNCTFSGNHQAALLRGGEYTITNSTFTLKAELASTHGENKHLAPWGAGNKTAFAGITIGNYKSSAYQYYSKVDMKNVTVKVEGSNASSFPAMHVCANSAGEKGVTLTYDNQCSFTSSYTPSVECGTTNITVNGTAVIENNGQFIVPENK